MFIYVYIYVYIYMYIIIYMGPQLLYIIICSGNRHPFSNYFGVLSGSLDCGVP